MAIATVVACITAWLCCCLTLLGAGLTEPKEASVPTTITASTNPAASMVGTVETMTLSAT
jgi:hypothetical protein